MWQRWNQTTHIFEKSDDNGGLWTPLGLDGSIISEGTVAAARIASLDASKITTGAFDVARIPSLDASKITSGALDKARQHAQTAYKDEANVFSLLQDFTLGLRERGRSVAMGEWTTYTPTWTNLIVGNGSQTARYARSGKSVIYTIRFTFGSTSSVTGNIGVTTPTSHMGDAVPKGHVVIFDGTTAARYPGIALPSGSTALNLFHAVSPMTIMNAGTPKAFTNLDQIYIWGSYEEP